jgi:hypothetical protein
MYIHMDKCINMRAKFGDGKAVGQIIYGFVQHRYIRTCTHTHVQKPPKKQEDLPAKFALKQAERARAAAERKALAELDGNLLALFRAAREDVGNNKIQMGRLKRFDLVSRMYVCMYGCMVVRLKRFDLVSQCVYVCMYVCIIG